MAFALGEAVEYNILKIWKKFLLRILLVFASVVVLFFRVPKFMVDWLEPGTMVRWALA